jgi:hypothetical protein
MAGEGHSFPNACPAVVLDEVKPHKVVPGRRRNGGEALVLERGHPAVMRVRHRRLGIVTITASDYDARVHEKVE